MYLCNLLLVSLKNVVLANSLVSLFKTRHAIDLKNNLADDLTPKINCVECKVGICHTALLYKMYSDANTKLHLWL